MITVNLMGGLGNQMFQYAFGIALSKINDREVYFDEHYFLLEKDDNSPVDKRACDLQHYNVKINFAPQEDINKHFYRKKSKIPRFIRKIFKIPRIISKDIDVISEEQISTVPDDLIVNSENMYFKGYFGHEKYFLNYRKDVLEAFTLKTTLSKENSEMLEKIKNTNSVSLHIRRGDYVKLQHIYVLIDMQYYAKAMDFIASKSTILLHFYIFSNDIKWIMDNFKTEYPFTIVNINNEENGFFDMELMKNCKHNIVANSTFSWWAAWLNTNEEKIVVLPDRCYVD